MKWKLVPVDPTDEMAMKLIRVWLLSDQHPEKGDFLEAKGYLSAALAASPDASDDEELVAEVKRMIRNMAPQGAEAVALAVLKLLDGAR